MIRSGVDGGSSETVQCEGQNRAAGPGRGEGWEVLGQLQEREEVQEVALRSIAHHPRAQGGLPHPRAATRESNGRTQTEDGESRDQDSGCTNTVVRSRVDGGKREATEVSRRKETGPCNTVGKNSIFFIFHSLMIIFK